MARIEAPDFEQTESFAVVIQKFKHLLWLLLWESFTHDYSLNN